MGEYRVIDSTINVVDPSATTIDFKWARGTRDRFRGTLTVQCWGCGGTLTVKDTPWVEMTFPHAIDVCSYNQALENRALGVMPVPGKDPS